MKKNFVLILAIIIAVLCTGCINEDGLSGSGEENVNYGNTGNAVSYNSPMLRIVEEYQTSDINVNASLTSGDLCKYGIVIGWQNEGDGWDALGALFGGDNFVSYIHIKTCVIRNCIVWESIYTSENVDISISDVSTLSCAETTQKSISIAASLGNKDKLQGSASYNYEQSTTSTIEYATKVQNDFSINVNGLDVENYKYAKVILADVEIVKVFKVVETIEWFQKKYKITESHTYVRFLSGTDKELRLVYKEHDVY